MGEFVRWIPAFAGTTAFRARVPGIVIPAKAGIHFDYLNHTFLHFPLDDLTDL
jgi:hypothetical protein